MATWCEELTHLKRPLCWERLKAGREGDNRGWDSWMASLTWWTWVWASYRSWWRTEKPGVLQSMGSKELDMTEWLNWTELICNLIMNDCDKLFFLYFKSVKIGIKWKETAIITFPILLYLGPYCIHWNNEDKSGSL